MSVIAIQIEPHRTTRVFFDCSNAAADPVDQRRIELAIEHSIALPEPGEAHANRGQEQDEREAAAEPGAAPVLSSAARQGLR